MTDMYGGVIDFEDWFYGKRMKRHWECYVEGSDGGGHYRHWTLASAQLEAERLSRLPANQGRMVYLFECVGRCQAEPLPVKWEIPHE